MASNGFNVDNFIKAFPGTSMVASPAYFEAYFLEAPNSFNNLKADVKARQANTFKNLRFRASSADLPSRQMVSVQRAFNGPHKLVPYSSIYASTIIEFIETPNYDIRAFFDIWQGLMEGYQRNFQTEYYEDLVSPVMVVVAFNREGAEIRKWRFLNVFPVSVNPTQLNWSTQNGITTVSVELSYYRWEDADIKSDSASITEMPKNKPSINSGATADTPGGGYIYKNGEEDIYNTEYRPNG